MLWRKNWQRIFIFAMLFFAADWLRGHVLTGFPWHLPAYGWGALPSVMQTASLVGAYGLSLLTLLFGASLALIFDKPRRPNVAIVLALIFAVGSAWGEWRLSGNDHATVPGVNLRIVQPSTSQREKYKPQFVQRNWRRLLDLSRAPAARPVTHIVWPEAAPPIWWLDRQPAAIAEITELLGADKHLLTGATRIELERGAPLYYNSFHAFGPGGRILATYDKFHLVPFGEYLPFESTLKMLGISQIAGGSSSFSSGPGPQTLETPGIPPFGPLICYEVIFPNAVIGTKRPGWLLNLTDDSWFGPDAGPSQHLLIARVRAIEEGLPIVRAANSGISTVIDAYGEMRAHLELDVRGFLDSPLPAPLAPTLYARGGNIVVGLLFLVCLGAALWPLSTRKT
jgi:apolipoprotein N-acyltransferase